MIVHYYYLCDGIMNYLYDCRTFYIIQMIFHTSEVYYNNMSRSHNSELHYNNMSKSHNSEQCYILLIQLTM